MTDDPLHAEPARESPRERGLRRRSAETGLAPWTAAVLILMLVVVAYVIWSTTG